MLASMIVRSINGFKLTVLVECCSMLPLVMMMFMVIQLCIKHVYGNIVIYKAVFVNQ